MELRIYDDIRSFLGCSEYVPRMLSRYFQDVLVSFGGLVGQVGLVGLMGLLGLMGLFVPGGFDGNVGTHFFSVFELG